MDEEQLKDYLVWDRVYGNPGTDGTFLSNYLFRLKNDHPVLGIFFCHPLHPFSRVERVLSLFVTSCFALMLSCFFNSDKSNFSTVERVIVNVVAIQILLTFVYQILAAPYCQNPNRPLCYKM